MQKRIIGAGIDHKDIATSMKNLGDFLLSYGELAEANEFRRDADRMIDRLDSV